jgi:hypothetical protein
MFDVPLNDGRQSYIGNAELSATDALTSETQYARAPSGPTKKNHSKRTPSQMRVGNLTEDEEYSFDPYEV